MTVTRRNPIMERAAHNVATALGLPAEAVTLGTGAQGDAANDAVYIHHGHSSDEHPKTNLLITIEDPNFELMTGKEAQTAVLAALDKLEPIKKIALTVPDENTAVALHAKLKAVTEGTKFDSRLLNWPGFNPEIAKKGWGVGDHAIDRVSEGAYGVEFSLAIPRDKHADNKKLLEDLKANVTARLPAIREMLTERALKYVNQNMLTAGKNAEEIAAAVTKTREDMAKLDIHINTDDEYFGNNVSISLRSPEQAAAVAALGNKVDRWGSKPENADALRASNPLHQLTSVLKDDELEKNPDASPQLHKAVGRAFLFAGEKAADEFPLVAGRRDIRNAILKELVGVSKGHPERAALVAEIMESNLLKNHQGFGEHKQNALELPSIGKNAAKPGQLQVWINLPETMLKQTVHALAEPAPSQVSMHAKPAIAATPDSVLAAAQQSADMMSLATPESAASVAPATEQHGFVNAIKSMLPASWVGRTAQAPASNSAQIG